MKKSKSPYKYFWSAFQFHQTLQNQIISYSKYKAVVPWNKIERAFAISRNNNISYYYSKKDFKANTEKGKIFLKKKSIDNYFRIVEKFCREYDSFYKELRKANFRKLSNLALLKYVEKSVKLWSYAIGIFKVTQAEGMHYLVKELEKSVSKKDALALMTPVELDEVNKELIDWQKILIKPFSRKMINSHLEKYPWLVFFHSTRQEAQDTINERFRQDKKNKKLKNIIAEKKKLRQEQAKIIKKYNNIKQLVDVLQKFALARMRIKSLWAGSDYNCIPLFEEIGKRTGESIVNLEKIYLLKDIHAVLIRGKKLSEKERKDRKKSFAVLWKNNRAIYKSGIQAEKLAKRELKELYEIAKTNEIKGISANSGIARGVAKILLSGDIENARRLRKEFRKGQILVTQMTQPNVMDIAGKASALVTNEGGLLSHAAIISRELKIPCLVGTHVATDVIKDGDLVEVDADKGVVKILKRK